MTPVPFSNQIKVPLSLRILHPEGRVEEKPLEDYVRGVVTAVLPADAPFEALKAQAIAARTFACAAQRHPEKLADVCTTRHCQLWSTTISAEAARAVDETRGLVAIYEGKLIQAFYFDHCDGKTRNARGILIAPAPYCRAVECACGFVTLHGHGIGMCQQGALVMARQGKSAVEILQHYFSGIELVVASEAPRPVAPPRPPAPPRLRPGAFAQTAKQGTTSAPTSSAPFQAPAATPGPAGLSTPPGKDATPPTPPATLPAEAKGPLSGPEKAEPPLPPALFPRPVVPTVREVASPPADRYHRSMPPPRPQLPVPARPQRPKVITPQREVEISRELLARLEPPKSQEPVAPPFPQAQGEGSVEDSSQSLPAFLSTAPGLVQEPPLPPDLPEPLPEIGIPARARLPAPGLMAELPEPVEGPAATSPAMEAPDAAERPPSSTVAVERRPGPRRVAGDAGSAGVIVTIRDTAGNVRVAISGTAPQYGEGGFEIPMPGTGAVTLEFGGKSFPVELDEGTLVVGTGK